MNVAVIDHVSKIYGSGHTEVTAVDDVSFSVKQGDIILVIGPSGSGKTTLVTMMGALLKPTWGNIEIQAQNIAKLSSTQLTQVRLKEIGFIFQSFNLLSALTAQENVALPLIAAGTQKKGAMYAAKTALEKLDLGHRLRHLPRDLSGGEKQRVSVARALVNNPALILADEPTANLDSKTGHEVMSLLCAIACAENKGVVIVSHDTRIQDIAKTILYFEDGHVTRSEAGGHDQHCAHHPYDTRE